MTIIPDLVAQHPDNRGGIAINSSRTDELLLHVLGHFDEEEACHGAVVVEERPGGCSIREYNLKKQAENPALAGVSDAAIPYGSVGSSHINQVLRNIKFGAKTEVAPEIQDNEGKLNIDKCAGVDPALAEACSKGLRWEVLSWKIEEEFDGSMPARAGLSGRAAAQMMEHEVQSISQFAKLCAAGTNAASDVQAEKCARGSSMLMLLRWRSRLGSLTCFASFASREGMHQRQCWSPCWGTTRRSGPSSSGGCRSTCSKIF